MPLFENDLSEIINYIIHQLNNKPAANDILNKIETAIMDRLRNPESFELYQSAKDREHPYFRIYVKNFIIYYVILDDVSDESKIMEVRRVLYSKRDKRKLE